MPTRLTVSVSADFRLPSAVCSYGYFILAPNRWCPEPVGALVRPLRTRRGAVVVATIRQPGAGPRLRIDLNRTVGAGDHTQLKAQVRRMLRTDEDQSAWHRLQPTARRRFYGRLFRSPTLFEDMVKTMTGCNVSWPNTVRMNKLLCRHIGRDGDFPTPTELAATQPARLRRLCKVGYRAERIVGLARAVERGRLDLDAMDSLETDGEALRESLLAIDGIGPYSADNILQLVGHYHRVPVDTETVRHLRQVHGADGSGAAIARGAQDRYDRYAPFQFKAYWFELWRDYERRKGDAEDWPVEVYDQFTASKL